MPKIIRTTDTDYRIITGQNGIITLDTTNSTGDDSGKVVITGDLEVNGGTTTIESTITTIEDSIIVLANGTTTAGLPGTGLDRPYSAGIEIERGSLGNSRWIYDDNITWDLGVTGRGAWLGTQGDIGAEQQLPIKTMGIISDDDLYIDTNDGVITVSGTNNYETKIWFYQNGVITPDSQTNQITQDDDYIPNAKAVKDLVDYSLETISIDKIQEDNSKIEIIDKNNIIGSILTTGTRTVISTTASHGYAINDTIVIKGISTSPTDSIIESLNNVGQTSWTVTGVPSSTSIEINADTTAGNKSFYIPNSGRTVSDESGIVVEVENTNIANFYNNRINLADLEVRATEIFTTSSNDDLILNAQGTGSVKIKDTLELTKTPGDDDILLDPNAPLDGIKLYSKTQSSGKTGLYFVNDSNYQDEIISKNRALLYSIIF